MISQGRSLELFFVDGRPDGMLTAEVFNWTGHVLRTPRTQLKEALAREEAGFTGVYLLFGERDGDARLYIGEAEDMRLRLKDHAVKKDWWEFAVLITSAANNLHKAHVKYLESRLVEIATEVGNIQLDNGNIPPRSSLNEAAQANMESYIDTLMIVLPAIRIDAFLSKKRSVKSIEFATTDDGEATRFTFKMPRHDVEAYAVLRQGELIVEAGSRVRPAWVGDRKHNAHYYRLHDELVAKKIIRPDGSGGVMVEDYAFSSPSAAAAVVAGRSANGRTSWTVIDNGMTYAEWEERNLEEDQE
ncbi:GIY-YIG nuclease family protein [Yoonia sp. SDW83-1]|uniref:GIY-YIG nuclease family protein n=1 Tax=Yoonia sp. SDW83-1 TaxID=3366945 RepID=UPI00398C5A36